MIDGSMRKPSGSAACRSASIAFRASSVTAAPGDGQFEIGQLRTAGGRAAHGLQCGERRRLQSVRSTAGPLQVELDLAFRETRPRRRDEPVAERVVGDIASEGQARASGDDARR